VSPALGRNPMAQPVVDLFTRYFAAINNRDWGQYRRTYAPDYRTSFNAEAFYKGYESTHDSDARLLSLHPSSDGRTVVLIAFTSRQNAADSPDQNETCTDWQIRYWVEQDGGKVFIGRPPQGHHFSYTGC
jgi:hypothetical protein